MGDMIRNVNLNVIAKKVILFSWQSVRNCRGFAYVQEKLDMDLSLSRCMHTRNSDKRADEREANEQDRLQQIPSTLSYTLILCSYVITSFRGMGDSTSPVSQEG